MRYQFVSLVLLAACTQNGEAKDYYDDVEAGSTWQLAIDHGKLVDAVYGPDYYKGACPTFAPRTTRIPADGSLVCDPGCTCSFEFFLADDGDVGHRYALDAHFEQRCTDGSALLCDNADPMHDDTSLCIWTSGKIDPKVDSFGDCSYDFTQTRTD